MALKITRDCISCEVCVPECPNEAIFMGPQIFHIDPDKCTECVGYYKQPQCLKVCPVDCIVADPEHKETPEQLQAKSDRLLKA